MIAPLSVADVTAMESGEVNAASADFSHLTTLPVLPERVRSAGAVPEQIVWAEETVPPTLSALTEMVTGAELAFRLLFTAR
jgi:hypothetical protein